MRYFIIAGEASGDLHASNLINELKEADKKADFQFLGGDLMATAAGKAPVIHYRDMAFMGFINVALNLRTVLGNMKRCKEALAAYKPDVLILIDYPSFNLDIAKFAKKTMAGMPVYYYISPKIWAWKTWRVKAIKKLIDRMYTILPFETEFYKQYGYEVEYVGNPSVDAVARHMWTESEETKALDTKRTVALLAGSRKQEIRMCLPRMLEVAERFTDYDFVVAGAPGVEESFYKEVIGKKHATVVFGHTYDLLKKSRAAIVNSGTATLETALLRVPEVVVYNLTGGRLVNIAQKLVIKVKWVSLVNLIANREVVPELIAADFTVEKTAVALAKILQETAERKKMLEGMDEVIEKLGAPGAAKKAARAMVRDLEEKNKQ
ncbi:MAG: lipid-A-disaccharide synthase [Paludibacteraceae bacterium]|nr:lipid-A-disaccharide synthase [Paludibacteraceae bacterium]